MFDHSLQGHSTNDTIRIGDATKSCFNPPLRYGQETSDDRTAVIYPPSATAPPNNNSNHVNSVHDATIPLSNLADHSGTASNTSDFSKTQPSIFAQPPPSSPSFSAASLSSSPRLGMGYQPRAHDNRSYCHGVAYDAVSQASSSQYTLDAFPGHYGHPTGITSYSQACEYTRHANQYDGGAVSRDTAEEFAFDDEHEEEAEMGYETSDVDMDTYQQFSPMEFEVSNDPAQKLPPISEPEWYSHSNYWIASTIEDAHQQQLAGLKQGTYVSQARQAETCLAALNQHYYISPYAQGHHPHSDGSGTFIPSPYTNIAPYSEPYPQDARNTPSDISSSGSPLSPIETVPYPVSQFTHIANPSTTALAPYPYPYCSGMIGAYPYDGIVVGEPCVSTAAPTKTDIMAYATIPPPEPFISSLLNRNPPDPVLHAPKPIRPIPTVSFEDLAATVSGASDL
ncbi:hypothetical protein Moror_7220 [Moniliophthora roreri MCA 2997]|uniref:Uncharacterized protein n=2 Tax=Moniliophthora roreri TaxID=221103 RepID=V2XUM8_MONRO|nr:hypothetical protein Moror_7220 [Moniliophthora roreri MCA 2997]KAI3622279.1 hypothetical protein WG66_015896 [Moniliophthora roreri]